MAAYTILRNDDLEPYRGRELYLRSALCALGYVALWGLFALLVARGVIFGDVWVWLFVVPPFALAGGLFAMAGLDLEFRRRRVPLRLLSSGDLDPALGGRHEVDLGPLPEFVVIFHERHSRHTRSRRSGHPPRIGADSARSRRAADAARCGN